MEIVAPWPLEFPSGRVLEEKDRHLTLAFLGDAELSLLVEKFSRFPPPPFRVGLPARFDRAQFLPLRKPHVAAWHVRFFEEFDYHKVVWRWLKSEGISFRARFSPHVTLARQPFVKEEWQRDFVSLPLYFKTIALCESFPFSHYEVRWSYPLLPPFEEREHTADIAYVIRGDDMGRLYLNAAWALAFRYPPLMKFVRMETPQTLEELIQKLNALIFRVDAAGGCPFKAVSFYGKVERRAENILEWEMIVDV